MLSITESTIDGFICVGDTVVFLDRRVGSGNRCQLSVDGPARVLRSGAFERDALQLGWRRTDTNEWRHEDGRVADTKEVLGCLRSR